MNSSESSSNQTTLTNNNECIIKAEIVSGRETDRLQFGNGWRKRLRLKPDTQTYVIEKSFPGSRRGENKKVS